jgi:hypothetical protein
MAARKPKPQTGMGPEAAVPTLSHEEIERRAYRIFRQRGSQPGRDLENWLAAERELLDEIRHAAAPRPRGLV